METERDVEIHILSTAGSRVKLNKNSVKEDGSFDDSYDYLP